MYPADDSHHQLDEQSDQMRQQEAQEGLQVRLESENQDRQLVRLALERGEPDPEIESRILLTTQFLRLNPEHDVHAYARALIEEEKSGFDASGAPVSPSPNEPSPSTTQTANSRSDYSELNSRASSRAETSEAEARQYITESFQPSDWLAVVVRNRETGETIQRISTADRIASDEFQAWLRFKNAHGSDIYLSLNTIKDHARGRTKADLKEIRHLYLDLDEDGTRKLAAIRQDSPVPAPNYVLNTSPEKYQVIWRVDGIGQDEAEALLRALAQRFGSDPAATDSTRVFRVPGFSNKKYEHDFLVTVTREAPASQVYRAADFTVEGLVHNHERPSPSPNIPKHSQDGEGNTQSEKDWAYALRKLRAGEDPEKLIRDMAGYRSVDHYDKRGPTKGVASKKADPRYYADRTVTRAMAHLGITRQSSSGSPTQPASASADTEIEPTR